jgi:hypothetical protein
VAPDDVGARALPPDIYMAFVDESQDLAAPSARDGQHVSAETPAALVRPYRTVGGPRFWAYSTPWREGGDPLLVRAHLLPRRGFCGAAPLLVRSLPRVHAGMYSAGP